jgi:hypothetical protein
MATDKEKNHFLIGECKFKNAPFNLKDLNTLLAKFKPSNNTARVYYYLFSKNGFSDELISFAAQKNIYPVTINQLIDGLPPVLP